ncbi:MAG: four helix bundle protein [Ferruginibacter sp.]|nr:four helix bundle protein [Chitinophagaceae bacterium]MBU9936216.1 four helix bundle protein [Ferruginibacter sp.]
MDNTNFGFEELELWKKARLFKNEIRELTKTFPKEEKFRLADQLIRSTRSVNALISEGHGRFTYPDQIHFCIQSRGSLTETVNHLTDAYDEAYITVEQLTALKTKAKELERLINGYLIYLRKKRDEEKKKSEI